MSELPRGTSRMSDTKLTWDVIPALDGTEPDRNFGRDPDVQRAYADHRAKLSAKGETLDAYVGRRILCGYKYAVCPNKFPYAADPSIAQYIVWCAPDEPHNFTVAKNIFYMATGVPPSQCVVMRNRVGRRSIPTIPHYHIFCRRKD